MSDFDTKMTEIALKLQIHALQQENTALRGQLRRLKYLLDSPVYSNEDSNCGFDLRSEEDRDVGKNINTMSNTPLTAKAKIACGFQAVPQSFLEHAEQLELDNDELRKAHHKDQSTLHDLRSVLDVTPLESFVQAAQRLKRENAALREDKERLDKVLASFYPAVAPIIEHYPIEPWEHLEGGRCRGRWAEDGSPYYFTVPYQLVPSFFALQRLAKLAEEKYAARKEAQP